jgi:hypothetical protein
LQNRQIFHLRKQLLTGKIPAERAEFGDNHGPDPQHVIAEHTTIMKAFASESPNGPSITHEDPDKVQVCIPVNWSITAIINLETLETSSDNITRTVQSIELLNEFLHVKASAIRARQDLLPELAREHELRAQQLHSQLLAQFHGALLFL